MQHMSPTAFGECARLIECAVSRLPVPPLNPFLSCLSGLNDWDDDDILASVLAVSQQEYLDTVKKSALRRDPSPDHS